MRVESLSSTTYRPSFNAKIVDTKLVQDYKKVILTTKEIKEPEKHIELFNKISQALENYPSDANIKIGVKPTSRKKSKTVNPLIETENATVTDFKRVKNNPINIVENSLKKIIDPHEGYEFRALVGETNSHTYEKWWNKNIFLLWNKVKETFVN